MSNNKTENYVPTKTKGPDGVDVYCPLPADSADSRDTVDASEECVEKDVVERYSGNIDIRNQEQPGG